MATTQILITKTGSFNIKDILKEIEAEKPKFPKTLGNEAVRMYKSAFDSEGGITDDSTGGWKSHKDTPIRLGRNWKVLNKTGALKNSIRVNLRSKNRKDWSDIVLVSNLPYSRLQNFGTIGEYSGESIPTIQQTPTDKQRKFFKFNGYYSDDSIWYKMSEAKRLDIDVPARHFLGHSKKVNDRMIQMIIKKFDRIMKVKSSNP